AFFEEQYTALAAAIDVIAEQVRILGDRPPSSLKEFLELASLKESFGKLSENDMLTELLSDHEGIVQQLQGAIDNAQEAKDESTADLLIDRVRDHDKIAWMIRSHLG
ncbi:MAG: DNA starvation/stationary phase protection protein, partial [Chlamydiota bacterium]